MAYIPAEGELEFSAIRAQGPGGQNVNKVSTAVQLRFNVSASGMPAAMKARLAAIAGTRMSKGGILVIRAQGTRSQEQNRSAVTERLLALLAEAAVVPTVRHPTKPTRGSVRRRLEAKATRSEVKAGRGKVHA